MIRASLCGERQGGEDQECVALIREMKNKRFGESNLEKKELQGDKVYKTYKKGTIYERWCLCS